MAAGNRIDIIAIEAAAVNPARAGLT